MAFTRPKAAQIDFDITNITDPLIRLNSGETGSADKDVGIVIERGDDTNVAIIYDESADQFVLVNTAETGTTSGNVTISSYAGLQADAIVYGSLNDGTTTLTATVAELNILDGVTATATELNYVDGVTSAIQTQLDAKLALAGGTMSGAIAMGTNKITGMGDPTANQDAATKAYVDTQTSSIVTTTDIAGDTGTDTVTLGTDTLTFTGGSGITTAVTNNTVTINTSGAAPDIELDSAVGDNTTTDFTVTTAPTAAEDLLVTINGLVQRPTTDYTVSGTTVTFGTAPFTGAVVAARTITAASTGPELSADTTPQLGGNLDLNSNDITGTGNVNITGNITSSGDLTVDTDTLYVDSTNNRVGVGTTSPSGGVQLDVRGTGVLQLVNTDTVQLVASSGGSTLKNVSNNPLIFGTNNTERMRILSSGGLTFNGDTAAANALDDYEEGTWTLTPQTNSGTAASIGTSSGIYTKVGRLVTIIGVAENITPGDTSTSIFRIGGLPFTPANENSTGSAVWDSISFQGASTRFYFAPQARQAGYIQFMQCGENNASTALDHGDLDAGGVSDIEFTITYMV